MIRISAPSLTPMSLLTTVTTRDNSHLRTTVLSSKMSDSMIICFFTTQYCQKENSVADSHDRPRFTPEFVLNFIFTKLDHLMSFSQEVLNITSHLPHQAPLLARKAKLQDAERLKRFLHDVEDEEAWIREKEPVASSTNTGK